MTSNPLGFTGRLTYQSVKLILRIAFILTGGLLSVLAGCFFKIATNSQSDGPVEDDDGYYRHYPYVDNDGCPTSYSDGTSSWCQ